MNAHVDFLKTEKTASEHLVAKRIVEQQSDLSWMDVVGGCDDCSTIPYDSVAAGRTRSLVLENDRLVMREDRFGSLLD